MKKSELYDLAICCVATRWINGEECIEDDLAIAALAELFERRSAELWNENTVITMNQDGITITPYTGDVPGSLPTTEANA